MDLIRACRYCEIDFVPKRPDQYFCDKECRYKYNSAKAKNRVLKVTPMSRSQAMRNAFLSDRGLDSLEQYIEETFKRAVVSDEEFLKSTAKTARS